MEDTINTEDYNEVTQSLRNSIAREKELQQKLLGAKALIDSHTPLMNGLSKLLEIEESRVKELENEQLVNLFQICEYRRVLTTLGDCLQNAPERKYEQDLIKIALKTVK